MKASHRYTPDDKAGSLDVDLAFANNDIHGIIASTLLSGILGQTECPVPVMT